jgi:hypothetical protein
VTSGSPLLTHARCRHRLLATLATLAWGCGRSSIDASSAGNGQAPQDAGLDRAASDDAPSDVAVRGVEVILGMMAFNEPMNAGYVRDLVPSWRSDGLTFASSGRVTGVVTMTAAGSPPTGDQWRDVLFWNVVGEFSFCGDAVFIPLSPITGVVASTSAPGTATFTVDAAFDLTVIGPDGTLANALAFAVTWVRVYRTGAALQYQVLPGARSEGDLSSVSWDRATGPVSGPLSYYTPLSGERALGSDFDYPSWIRTHVTWP